MTDIRPDCTLRYQEENSDKIWGYITTGTNTDNYYTFWGKVGATIAFKSWSKTWESKNEIENTARNKRRKGYELTSMENLSYDAQEKFQQAAVMAILGLLRFKSPNSD